MYFSLKQLAAATGLSFLAIHTETRHGHLETEWTYLTYDPFDKMGRIKRCLCVSPAMISKWLDERRSRPIKRRIDFDDVVERLAEIAKIKSTDVWESMYPSRDSYSPEWTKQEITDNDALIAAMVNDSETPDSHSLGAAGEVAAPRLTDQVQNFLTSLLFEF